MTGEGNETTEHQGHLDRDTAERLLGGAAATPVAGADQLALLLASAAAAPRAHELSGEDAAAMAFREAAAQPRPSKRGFWRRLLTFKAIAALIAMTISGLAFASSTGVIPRTFKVDPMPSPVQPPVRPNPQVPKLKPATTPSTSTSPTTEEVGRGCDNDGDSNDDCDDKSKKSRSPKPSKSPKRGPRPGGDEILMDGA